MLSRTGRGTPLTWVVLTVATLAACTSSPAPAAQPRSSAPSSPAAANRPVELSCAEAGSGAGPGTGSENVSAGGLTLEDLARPLADVPRVPSIAAQRFRKTPADVAAGSGPVTVALLEASPGQALMWVPADQWNSSLDPQRWTTSAVTFDGCPDHEVTYFGGLLGPTPDTCLHLRITAAGAQVQDHRLRLDGRSC